MDANVLANRYLGISLCNLLIKLASNCGEDAVQSIGNVIHFRFIAEFFPPLSYFAMIICLFHFSIREGCKQFLFQCFWKITLFFDCDEGNVHLTL